MPKMVSGRLNIYANFNILLKRKLARDELTTLCATCNSTEEIVIISLASSVGFIIIVAGIVLAVVGKCSIVNAIQLSMAFMTFSVCGTLLYFSLSDEVDWVITSGVVAGLITIFFLIAVFSAFCDRFADLCPA